MANSLDRQVTVEGHRNVVVKFTGVLDTSNINSTPAYALSDVLNLPPGQSLLGFRVDLLEYSISPGLEVSLSWNSNVPQLIFPLSGKGRIDGSNYGGFLPNTALPGYTGDINLVTRNFVPGVDGQGQPIVQSFTIVLEMIKLYNQNPTPPVA